MINVVFKYNNKDIVVQAEEGETLLEVAQHNNIPLIGGCGGAGICGSCLVNIDPEWINKLDEPEFSEQDLLECLPMYKSTSRLACQVKLNSNLDGLIVIIE